MRDEATNGSGEQFDDMGFHAQTVQIVASAVFAAFAARPAKRDRVGGVLAAAQVNLGDSATRSSRCKIV
jgi:hypothetical protein